MGAYIGVGGKARKAAGMYVGVGGKAKRVVKAYVGDDAGKAKPWFSAGEKLISFTFDLDVTQIPSASAEQPIVFRGTYHAYEGTTISDWMQSGFAVCESPWKVAVIVKGSLDFSAVYTLTNNDTKDVYYIVTQKTEGQTGNPVILDGDRLSVQGGSIVIEHAAG